MNDQGQMYGITYVDHKTKCVFNGSDLGKPYRAKGIGEMCCQNHQMRQEDAQKHRPPTNRTVLQNNSPNKEKSSAKDLLTATNVGKLAADLLQPTHSNNYLPHQFKKRKKKRRKISNN